MNPVAFIIYFFFNYYLIKEETYKFILVVQ